VLGAFDGGGSVQWRQRLRQGNGEANMAFDTSGSRWQQQGRREAVSVSALAMGAATAAPATGAAAVSGS
jgi:hypothetical protein